MDLIDYEILYVREMLNAATPDELHTINAQIKSDVKNDNSLSSSEKYEFEKFAYQNFMNMVYNNPIPMMRDYQNTFDNQEDYLDYIIELLK